ncbi:DUF1801 domain-containing protein [Cohnella sp. CFH 77786]|uniref:DUF1801 domain-containing protein n=1 Tax=Cohnella sp. CFH 77786 TaxID=2662265 RepID=UPI001C608F8F|nr:DUF1801 domain-containing protein [Cohnella sp. CFH 77786]MBW5448950.1 DUF1801 domain-containing protein [Cohnella sp. CFH 77786]
MNEEVKAFIENLQEPWQSELCSRLRDMVHRTLPDVQERMQYKKPHFLQNGKYAAVISTSKDAVSFTIFNASGVDFPDGLFDGPPERKTIKIRNGQAVDDEGLSALLRQAASSL